MVEKKEDMKSMQEMFLSHAREYVRHVIEREPLPADLKLKDLEIRKVSISSQLEFLNKAREKVKFRLDKIDQQINQLKDTLATTEKDIKAEKEKVKMAEKKEKTDTKKTNKKVSKGKKSIKEKSFLI